MDKSDFNGKIKNWLNSKFKWLESIFALVFLLAMILKLNGIPFMSFVILIALNMLAVLYVFNSSLVSDDEDFDGNTIFVNKMVSYGLAISMVGILFKLFSWPNSDQFLLMGMVGTGAMFAVIVYNKINKKNSTLFNGRYLLRMACILSLVITLKVVPKSQLAHWKIIGKSHGMPSK